MKYSSTQTYFVKSYYIIWVIAFILLFTPFFLFAAEGGFVPLEPLPGITNANDPVAYFNSLFRLGVIIAGFLAIIMIVIGGFKYMTTDSVSGKEEGKEAIVAALSGLFLILLSVLLLQIINPDILDFNLFRTK